jgi:hypothetical protein
MPTKKPRYFDVLRAELLPGESLDQGTPRILAELRGLRTRIAARDAEIVELRADVAKWRLEVEATANRGVVLVHQIEADARAITDGVAKCLGEHRLAKGAAERALCVAEAQNATVRGELAKAKEWAVRAELAYTDERRASARQVGIHAAALSSAVSYARLTGGILGVVVGVLVTVLVVAAL